ncbi:MAG: hypothetical protein B6D61_02710 [Bacteroidetes bacterium 4484_249]|nr:MAG: hypothetical protein B6D61_02710 [Bacteroidetes bacterium 4484_249]
MDKSEIINKLGEDHENYFKAVAPPIMQTSNFCYSSVGEMRNAIVNEFMTFGGIISPFDAWLMIRGLRTLPLRLEKSSTNTKKVITFLENHPKVGEIIYPHHHSHPQFDLAQKQMKDSSGLFSVKLKADSPVQIEKFCEALKYFRLAVSWGGYESLVFPAITTYNPAEEKNSKLPWNMLRLYTGLEEPDMLINDLDFALKAIKE